MKDLKEKVINSLQWTVSSQILRETLQVFITIVLARLLEPKDFGLVAMSASFMVFIDHFTTMGLWGPLIQMDNIGKKHYSTAFYSMLFFNTLLFLITYLSAPYVASFFKENILTLIIRLGALNFFLTTFSLIPTVILERKLQYNKIAFVEITKKIIIGITAITLALKGYGVWALVIAGLIGNSITLPALFIMTRWTPNLLFDFATLKEMLRFGTIVTFSGLLALIIGNFDNIIIGRFLGATALGYYNIAYGLMAKPIEYISSSVGRIFFPAFSNIKNDILRIKNIYLKLIEVISTVVFPLMIGLLFVAPQFISVVYGSKWLSAVPVLQALCLVGALKSIGNNTGAIFFSQGKPEIDFKIKLIYCPIYLIAFLIGVNFGLLGVANAYVICSFLLWPWPHFVANKLIDLENRKFFILILKIGSVTFLMYLCLSLIKVIQIYFLKVTISEIATLTIYTFLGIGIYSIFIFIFNKKTVNELLSILIGKNS